jgi:hypothetical protein
VLTGIAPSVLWEQDPIDLRTMLDVIEQAARDRERE